MIGIMQGRLSPQINEYIQCFPNEFWKAEFFIASAVGLQLIEWTLDHQQIETNPFLNNHAEIKNICSISGVSVESVTYDAAMQSPLVSNGRINDAEVTLLCKVLENARVLGVKILVLPLVDGATVIDKHYLLYVKLLKYIGEKFLGSDLKIAIESDYPPKKLINFIEDIDCDWVGINYDIGNSAALGYDFDEEMKLTGKKILNIHVKDRALGGVTCPFGEGSNGLQNKISELFRLLPNCNLIIQGARSVVGNDVGIAVQYFEYIKGAIENVNSDIA